MNAAPLRNAAAASQLQRAPQVQNIYMPLPARCVPDAAPIVARKPPPPPARKYMMSKCGISTKKFVARLTGALFVAGCAAPNAFVVLDNGPTDDLAAGC